MDEIQRVSISDLLAQAVPHEEWLAPLDKRLQAGLAVAGAGMVAAIVASTMMLSSGIPLIGLAMVINVGCLMLIAAVGFETDGFRMGHLKWHKVSTGLVVVGSVDVCVLTIPILIVVVQFFLWLLMWALIIGFVLLIIGGLLAG